MNTRTSIRPVVVALALTLGAPSLAHQGHADVSIEDLARRAGVVAEGVVESAVSSWDAQGGQIHTTVRLRVAQYHKGGDAAPVIEFTQLGGTVGDTTLFIVGAPVFSAGEDVLVFLRPDYRLVDQPTVEMEHGKYVVQIEPDGQAFLIDAAGAATRRTEGVSRILDVNAALRPVPIDRR